MVEKIEEDLTVVGSSSVVINPGVFRNLIMTGTHSDDRETLAPLPRLNLAENACQSLSMAILSLLLLTLDVFDLY